MGSWRVSCGVSDLYGSCLWNCFLFQCRVLLPFFFCCLFSGALDLGMQKRNTTHLRITHKHIHKTHTDPTPRTHACKTYTLNLSKANYLSLVCILGIMFLFIQCTHPVDSYFLRIKHKGPPSPLFFGVYCCMSWSSVLALAQLKPSLALANTVQQLLVKDFLGRIVREFEIRGASHCRGQITTRRFGRKCTRNSHHS